MYRQMVGTRYRWYGTVPYLAYGASKQVSHVKARKERLTKSV
jgi:hypothetical protein